MSLIQKSPAEIYTTNNEAVNFIKAMMKNSFIKANTANASLSITVESFSSVCNI